MFKLPELVGGDLRFSRGTDHIESFNPATEELLGRAPEADAAVVMEAIRSARDAFDHGPWSNMSTRERADLLEYTADLLEENADVLARAETSDTGMTFRMTREGHLPRSVDHLRFFAREVMHEVAECLRMDTAYLQVVEREPLGVVAIFAPWNAPLAVCTMNLAAALALGNTVVIKSPERAPVTIGLLAQILAGAGFPPGVVNVVHGRGSITGTALALSDAVDGLCFVGSTDTAMAILARGHAPFRRNTLELGGKSPTVVLADAQLDDAVDGALLSVFSSNGEVCTAGSRILVHCSAYDAFVERFCARTAAIRVGDPFDAETEVGPRIDRAQLDAVETLVSRARRDGACVECGGVKVTSRRGYYFAPAVLTNVDPRSAIAKDEIFGPVATIIRFRDDEHAIALANDTRYGLSATVWCGDMSRGMAVARKIRCGVCAVNSPIIRDLRVPFGGTRASGVGRVGGRWSLEQYSEVKTTCIRLEGLPLPRLGLPASN